MLVNYMVGIALLLCLAALCGLLRGLVLSPVKGSENTKLTIRIEVKGENNELEHILKGLVWLRDNGTLKSDIAICLNEADENTRLIARAFSNDYQFISYNELGE